jgi:hypothetical protein
MYTLFVTLGIALFVSSVLAQSEETTALDKDALLEVEDLSESLANDLLEFSILVRDRNASAFARFFPGRVSVGFDFPDLANLHSHKLKWITYSEIDLSTEESRSVDRADFLNDWMKFLAQFSQIEDVRFKVKDARFESFRGAVKGFSRIKFFVVGKDHQERPIWMKGTGHLDAEKHEEASWRFTTFSLQEAQVQVAEVQLFSEVSDPAGLSVGLPSYGSPGNDNFVYHGAAAADLDQDGLIDIVVAGISDTYVYRNRGDGRFTNIAWDVGIPPNSNITAPLPLDFDNDGDLDLFFSATGFQMLFENRLKPDGILAFEDVSLEARIAKSAHGFSAVAGDANGDGWPDIYVSCYNRYGFVMPNSWHNATNGTPNLLFINQQDGTFRESAGLWGVRDARWSYASQFADLNGDGRQDLYVANDFGENAFYVNLGEKFEDRAGSAGVVDPGNGMGVSLGDYNNDGEVDIFVTNMSSTAGNRILNRLYPETDRSSSILRKIAAGSNLYRSDGDGNFTDVTNETGPFSVGWAWGGVFLDFDNDGWEDIYSASGFVSGSSMEDT